MPRRIGGLLEIAAPLPAAAGFRSPAPLPVELSHVWSRIAAELRAAVDDTTYRQWVAPLEPRSLAGSVLVLSAPDARRAWIANRFGHLLQACAAAVIGPEATVDLVPASAAAPVRSATGAGPTAGYAGRAPEPEPDRPLFNPKYTFDQFVIGDGNRFAHGAALAVAEQPGQAYNPLFLYGPPGLGKTHLLHSIANYVSAHGDGLAVRYATAETFTNEFIAAMRRKDHDAFKAGYRHADVLVVDDVQFLEGKAKIGEEFFHTFNALYESGSQLVFTSDRLPRDLGAVEDRLRERFASGLVTSVEPPDLATRMTILRKRAHHDGITIAEPTALERIAERITTNVRALEGALIRIVAFHSLTSRPITEALATEVLDGLYGPATPGGPEPHRACTIADIQDATCTEFGITREELLSRSRTTRIAWPRQVAMYLARELTDHSLPRIGREFGDRDHATVMHACKRTRARIAENRDALAVVHRLSQRLTGA